MCTVHYAAVKRYLCQKTYPFSPTSCAADNITAFESHQYIQRGQMETEARAKERAIHDSTRWLCVCVWAEPFWYFLIVLFVGSIACFFAHELITGIIWIVIKLFDVVWWVRERALCAATIDEQRLVFTSLALSHTILPISRWILMILKLMSASDVCSRDSRHF